LVIVINMYEHIQKIVSVLFLLFGMHSMHVIIVHNWVVYLTLYLFE
jgi:heme/copper-type cytochrome/quinol oxidase subunit 3